MKTISLMLSQSTIQKYRHQRVTLRDTNVPYLLFRYSKAGRYFGSFHVRFTRNGKSTSRVIGRFPLLGIKAARLAASKKYSEIQKNKSDVSTLKCFEYCGELLNRYWEYRLIAPGTSIKTKRNISHQIKCILMPVLRTVKVVELTSQLLAEKWLFPNYESYKISTLKSSFQCLKAAFNQMEKLGYLAGNPISKLSFTDLTTSIVKPKKCKIESRELKSLTNQISSFSPDMKMMCYLCLGYLTRNRETALARWEHFNFNKMLWHIPAENTKTGQSITHPITPIMLVLLKNTEYGKDIKLARSFYFRSEKATNQFQNHRQQIS